MMSGLKWRDGKDVSYSSINQDSTIFFRTTLRVEYETYSFDTGDGRDDGQHRLCVRTNMRRREVFGDQ